MTPSRMTPGRLSQLIDRLGVRDYEIISSLSVVRVATSKQLERLHFADGTPLANARACRSSLARLTNWGILTRLERRVGGVRAGSAAFVYALDVAGQKLAGLGGPAGGKRNQRPWTPSMAFLAHRLAVSEIYVQAKDVSRSTYVELEVFETEPTCWRHYTGPAGEALTLKPDAFARAKAEAFVDYFFVEVDLGTESGSALTRKFDRYREYWASGIEQRRYGVFPQVLWLAGSDKRRKDLMDVGARQPAESWQLFRVADLAHGGALLAGGRDA